MKYLLSIFCLVISLSCFAKTHNNEIIKQVHTISKLYGDGFAKLLSKTIKTKTLQSAKGACVNIASFYMEGFAGGNNLAQFIVFINCKRQNGVPESNKKFVNNVIGIHPFYHHRNTYNIGSAVYNKNEITISSPKGDISFYRKHSIWWSAVEQNVI